LFCGAAGSRDDCCPGGTANGRRVIYHEHGIHLSPFRIRLCWITWHQHGTAVLSLPSFLKEYFACTPETPRTLHVHVLCSIAFAFPSFPTGNWRGNHDEVEQVARPQSRGVSCESGWDLLDPPADHTAMGHKLAGLSFLPSESSLRIYSESARGGIRPPLFHSILWIACAKIGTGGFKTMRVLANGQALRASLLQGTLRFYTHNKFWNGSTQQRSEHVGRPKCFVELYNHSKTYSGW